MAPPLHAGYLLGSLAISGLADSVGAALSGSVGALGAAAISGTVALLVAFRRRKAPAREPADKPPADEVWRMLVAEQAAQIAKLEARIAEIERRRRPHA